MPRTNVLRRLTIPLAGATVLALVPGVAAAQERTTLLCPDPPPAADFDDRDEVSPVHREPVDCLAFLEIAEGRGYDEGVRYLPRADVRRDQMASFIARALESAGATLPAPQDQGFGDIDGSPHEDRIRQLAEVGITEGKSAERYAPGEAVSRDQMASFLVRATAWYRGVETSELAGGPTRFDDVDPDNVHAEAIAGSYHLGVARGVDAETYAPDREVSRQQMGSFIVGTLDAMHQDSAVCSNYRDGYTLTMPDGWVTNPGDVEPRCTVFDDERFLLEPATELPADTNARVLVEPIGYQEAADEGEHRDELSRRTDSANGHDAIVTESEATGDGLAPAGTRFYTWHVDATVDGQERTLIATTDTRGDSYQTDADGIDAMMDTLVLGVPTRTEVASYEGGGRPFTVAGWVSGQAGLCNQAVAGDAVSTVCAELGGLDELEVRYHEVDDGWAILTGSVDDTIDAVEVESHGGDVEEPTLVRIWGRQAFATGIPYDDVDEVRALRGGTVVATADLPDRAGG